MNFNQETLDKAFTEACENGILHKLDDGRLLMVLSEHHLGWYHIRLHKEACRYWHSIMLLPMFGKGKSFVPTACLNCWKVVCWPRNFDETMRLLGIMKRLDLKSKIGGEYRPQVPALWGAYFYNDTQWEGHASYREVYGEVRQAIFGDVPEQDMDKYIVLKRGCTEYEHGVNGPSDKWHPFVGQANLEKYIEKKIDWVIPVDYQTQFMKELTLKQWKEWAHSHGDFSYVPYNDGKRITEEYVTYHKQPQVVA